MPKGNKKATGKKTSEPLTTLRFGIPLKFVEKYGYKHVQKISREQTLEILNNKFDNEN